MPVVVAPDHVRHDVATGVWCGVTEASDELPARAEIIATACAAAGAEMVEADDHGLEALLRVHDERFLVSVADGVPNVGLLTATSNRRASRMSRRTSSHLLPGNTVAAATWRRNDSRRDRVLRNGHHDVHRRRHVDGRKGRRRRRGNRRRPRGRRSGRGVRGLPSSRSSRRAGVLRRQLLPQQRSRCGCPTPRCRPRASGDRRHRCPSRQRNASHLLERPVGVLRLRARRSGRGLVPAHCGPRRRDRRHQDELQHSRGTRRR